VNKRCIFFIWVEIKRCGKSAPFWIDLIHRSRPEKPVQEKQFGGVKLFPVTKKAYQSLRRGAGVEVSAFNLFTELNQLFFDIWVIPELH